MFENRETSLNGKSVWGTVRSTGSPAGEGNGRNTGMNGGEEPDGVVLPMNPANKGGRSGGEGGGKDANQGEHGSEPHAPRTGWAKRVTGFGRCASTSEGKQRGTIHHTTTSPDRRPAAGERDTFGCAGDGDLRPIEHRARVVLNCAQNSARRYLCRQRRCRHKRANANDRCDSGFARHMTPCNT